jgi:hypothetical protein
VRGIRSHDKGFHAQPACPERGGRRDARFPDSAFARYNNDPQRIYYVRNVSNIKNIMPLPVFSSHHKYNFSDCHRDFIIALQEVGRGTKDYSVVE